MEVKEHYFTCLEDIIVSRELEDGIIHVSGEVDEFKTKEYLLLLSEVKRKLKKGDTLTVKLCSEGGEVHGSFALYDALREISKSGIKVRVIVEGLAASAAAMIILQAGDIRIARPHATFLLHEPKRWVYFHNESTSQLETEVTEMNRITNEIVKILANRCGKTEEEVRETIRLKEKWMSPQEAKDWGLIDKIEEV